MNENKFTTEFFYFMYNDGANLHVHRIKILILFIVQESTTVLCTLCKNVFKVNLLR